MVFAYFQCLSWVSCCRYKDNRHVSMGAEKWLDIELWDSTKECFEMLKSCGYRIATTHVGIDAVLFVSANFVSSHPEKLCETCNHVLMHCINVFFFSIELLCLLLKILWQNVRNPCMSYSEID